ncbi:hypothetical protein B6S09_11330 [Oceanimonas baumannii]|uniref:Uncharacterized protein n=1 Tax=Oceanimonas baumannii TaxID=129578 RepID=A0A235CG46_9GAMM|nr:hypothetical protein B6S09_11330 [Oceanimonas baumannii]
MDNSLVTRFSMSSEYSFCQSVAPKAHKTHAGGAMKHDPSDLIRLSDNRYGRCKVVFDAGYE